MEAAEKGSFAAYAPKRRITESDVYAGKINKEVIHKISDKAFLELKGITEGELEVINRFLCVPRLPGISMRIAGQIHRDGLYAPKALRALSLEQWQRYRGIGAKRGKAILDHLASMGGP